MKPHIFENDLLNEIIETQAAGRTAAHHDNRIGPHLEGFDKIPQDDFEREANAFIGMEDAQVQGSTAGFGRNDIRNPGSFCNGFAEDVHRAQMWKGDLHPC
jgi:hypothetical protein